jgi:hypothetical protein
MSGIAFFELSSRLAKVLLDQSARAIRPGVKPKLSLSQTELAGMINATRETVNRCLRNWQRQGIVDVSERWITLLPARHAQDDRGPAVKRAARLSLAFVAARAAPAHGHGNLAEMRGGSMPSWRQGGCIRRFAGAAGSENRADHQSADRHSP